MDTKTSKNQLSMLKTFEIKAVSHFGPRLFGMRHFGTDISVPETFRYRDISVPCTFRPRDISVPETFRYWDISVPRTFRYQRHFGTKDISVPGTFRYRCILVPRTFWYQILVIFSYKSIIFLCILLVLCSTIDFNYGSAHGCIICHHLIPIYTLQM